LVQKRNGQKVFPPATLVFKRLRYFWGGVVDPVPDPGVVEEPVPVVPLVLEPEVLVLEFGLELLVPAVPFMLPLVPVESGVVLGCPGVPVALPLDAPGVVLGLALDAPDWLWSGEVGVADVEPFAPVVPLWLDCPDMLPVVPD